jgi:hypothetical protein
MQEKEQQTNSVISSNVIKKRNGQMGSVVTETVR